MVNVPVLYGNSAGSKSLHGSNRIIDGRDWAARVPDQAAYIVGSGAWIVCLSEVHAKDDEWKDSSYPAGGQAYILAAIKQLDPDFAIAGGAEGNWTYYRPSKVSVVAVDNHHFAKGLLDRGITDVTFQHVPTAFQFDAVNTHFTAHDGDEIKTKVKGKTVIVYSHDRVRAAQAREVAAYLRKRKRAFFGGDINSSSERPGFVRPIMRSAGWLGLRDRGNVVNGQLSSFSTSPKKSYWLDEIFTRKSETVTSAELVLTVGSGGKRFSDHRWLKATIGFDAGAVEGSPTGPYVAPPRVRPTVPPKSTGDPWTASARLPDHRLAEPVDFKKATLVENDNGPDALMLTGRLDALRPVMLPSYGIVLQDDRGQQRFSGRLAKVKRYGNGTVDLTFAGDLVWLWWRKCYPKPSADWTTAAQDLTYDVVAGSAEAKLLSLVNRNLGPAALDYRRMPLLRLPASQDRGPVGASSLRFDSLGQAVADLAESANLRVRIKQTYEGSTPYLDLVLEETPDLSDWAAFGTPEGGGPWTLSKDWSYEIDIPLGNAVLSAAGGEGKDRRLNEIGDQDSEDLWGARIETILDQRGTTDPAEIANGLTEALFAAAGPSETSVAIESAPGLGTTIPLGAQVAAVLDGEVIVDRIRQMTTVLTNERGEPSEKTTAVLGTPDAGIKTPTQRVLAAMLRRLQNLERI